MEEHPVRKGSTADDAPCRPPHIGKYRLEKQLGAGGMGVVWLGHHPDFGIPVAVKTIKAGQRDGDYVKRFLQEARSAALINHSRVARIFDAGSDGDTHYIVMELLPGGSVRDLLDNGPLDPVFALYIVEAAAEGLAAAAEAGIIHRDIKPDNIMLDSKGEPKLVDLGLAKETAGDSTLTGTGMMMGTPAYISPEQAQGAASVDTRADIYSLGATFFHMVTGEMPFRAENPMAMALKHCMDPTPDPRDINPELPTGICRLIMRMMEKDPQDRPQSPEALLNELEAVTESLGSRYGKARVRKIKSTNVPVSAEIGRTDRNRPRREEALPAQAADPIPPREPSRPRRRGPVLVAVAAVVLLIFSLWGLSYAGLPQISVSPPAGPVVVGEPAVFTLTLAGDNGGSGNPIAWSVAPANGSLLPGADGHSATLTAQRAGNYMVTVTVRGSGVLSRLRQRRTAQTVSVREPVTEKTVVAGSEKKIVTALPPVTMHDDTEYLAVDVSAGAAAAKYPLTYLAAKPADLLTNAKWKTTAILLRRIPAGTFMMGSSAAEPKRDLQDLKKTEHQVTLTKPFYIGVFEVTQRQWELVMGKSRVESDGAAWPAGRVSYDEIRGGGDGAGWPMHNRVDADSFLGRLRTRSGIALDLPTEAQWEYACRAGTTTAYSFGNDAADLHRYGNYLDRSGGLTSETGGLAATELPPDDGQAEAAEAGSYLANGWGLFDMHGNVWEWCLDWAAPDLGSSPVWDPVGPQSGTRRIDRGGGYQFAASECRSADREGRKTAHGSKSGGFRLALALPDP